MAEIQIEELELTRQEITWIIEENVNSIPDEIFDDYIDEHGYIQEEDVEHDFEVNPKELPLVQSLTVEYFFKHLEEITQDDLIKLIKDKYPNTGKELV